MNPLAKARRAGLEALGEYCSDLIHERAIDGAVTYADTSLVVVEFDGWVAAARKVGKEWEVDGPLRESTISSDMFDPRTDPVAGYRRADGYCSKCTNRIGFLIPLVWVDYGTHSRPQHADCEY